MKNRTCIITYTNEKFVSKVQTMITEIRDIGKYDGDIVVIIGEDLKDRLDYNEDNRVIIKHFPEIDREENIAIISKLQVILLILKTMTVF